MSLIKDRGRKEKDVHRGNNNFQSPTNMCWLLEAVCSQVSRSHERRQKCATYGREEAVEHSCLEESLSSESSTACRKFGFFCVQKATCVVHSHFLIILMAVFLFSIQN